MRDIDLKRSTPTPKKNYAAKFQFPREKMPRPSTNDTSPVCKSYTHMRRRVSFRDLLEPSLAYVLKAASGTENSFQIETNSNIKQLAH